MSRFAIYNREGFTRQVTVCQEAPLRVGRSVEVGMGAEVTTDVPDAAAIVGNPAKLIRTLAQED